MPRSEVERADYFSRIVDVDDWQVDAYWFKFICSRFGRPTDDRFADDYNKKVVRFNSRFFSRNTEAIDAFSCHWGGELNYLVPPLYLVPRVVKYLFC